ncbi:hypothetical protein 2AV2_1 [Nodularia phage vB_NpeS-2AV2]|uniref:Uncharacterized protein n=3 Tax=Ravarandavirus TaxID=2843444 RepID=A0A482MJP0_9CAUD|nr:hypothetical protein HWA92_gp001 [Nodularia phage vB_NpeS-2AV2]YP_009844810.1 hypothetical protein HWC13_gp001 [Nodularia phage vB_NspS-kac68v161]ALY07453.1 hypothetical protein 2AV2_1 [Nodularia phage vB_NpeS-2AV2]QBQ73651.1 hypothetical protein kac68v161_gp001 [Nodularia phage vB_NspS-kac68v161]QBQ73849.1 hypothetical protein kac68v162_gp001 [Nodularia phage vB_NspS-kac68v162]
MIALIPFLRCFVGCLELVTTAKACFPVQVSLQKDGRRFASFLKLSNFCELTLTKACFCFPNCST